MIAVPNRYKEMHSMNSGYYSPDELKDFNFKACGENVLISRKASLYMTSKMSFGHDVRIDDFCLLIGDIEVGSYVHIAAYTGIHVSIGKVTISDFCAFSSGVTIYTTSDDYTGEFIPGNVPSEYKKYNSKDIFFGRHAVVGTQSVILPGAYLPEGVAVGACSLVKKHLKPWWVYFGVPVQKLYERKRDLLQLEKQFLEAEFQKATGQ
jgi:galactoside O-acetyltransferase